MISTLRLRLVGGVALGVVMGIAVGDSHADVVIFKDGYLVQGQVDQKLTVITDSISGQSLATRTGPFHIKDNVRRISFSFTQVQEADKKGGEQNAELVQF